LYKTAQELASLVASAADVCIKPWRHAVVFENPPDFLQEELAIKEEQNHEVDFKMRIECRDKAGEKFPEKDLEVEVFQSGNDINLIMSWSNQIEKPMLWHGKHAVWMDSNNGTHCLAPKGGSSLEALARKLRSLLVTD